MLFKRRKLEARVAALEAEIARASGPYATLTNRLDRERDVVHSFTAQQSRIFSVLAKAGLYERRR